ncbi:Serine acetyltransferase [Cronobacter universalis NCTC 9529]|nr:Serine acetyltransferase [Cronobacter universalis NCTC 9529]
MIGDNVSIGASSCIIADQISIGNNVVIGAMSFINKDIPDNCTVVTEKTTIIKQW